MNSGDVVITVRCDADILVARQKARSLVQPLRFSSSDLTLIATAISEIARNIVSYAGSGALVLRVVERNNARGLTIVARDHGPGIADLARAMEDGYSTSGGLGLGLPGTKRLMDEFDVVSAPGKGTTVTMTKWER
ncbi:MAG TPA: anti-sigma regulatory factor [Stellaceae bacterium]|nr:anti-sigma regulatory factor [Stellaceae bacterium]